MRDQLLDLLEKADLALGSSRDVVEEKRLHPLIGAVTAVRTRLSYPEEILVVALAGGTGSGKSSLLNSLVGVQLVDVGGVRPTTSHPAAAIPAAAGDSLDGYLDRLGIAERHVHESHAVCLIDLPDIDSVETEHRRGVDALLPLVDVVVWVTDPEKYRDVRLHNEYLKPMSDYSDQFIFVMNQVDRLPSISVGEVCDDLVMALEADGLGEVVVIPTSASPPAGPPIGIEQLSQAIKSERDGRERLYEKLLTDLAATSRALEAEAGSGLDFDTRAEKSVGAAAEYLTKGQTPAAVTTLTGFLDSVAGESGGLTADKIEKVAAGVAQHVDRIRSQLLETRPPERKSWFRRRGRSRDEGTDLAEARALLSEAVVRPARAILAQRALAAASIADLTLEVDRLLRQAAR
jgi:GTPase Era involved in 16S rRNA processing